MEKTNDYLFTSESVTEGHPDKVADLIADSILDSILKNDTNAHVACEVLVTKDLVVIAGEISSRYRPDIEKIARRVIKDIGYTEKDRGFDHKTCKVMNRVNEQSKEIFDSVKKKGIFKDPKRNLLEKHFLQGAGDQGLMFGYASNETKELMPLPITLAHGLSKQLAHARKEKLISYLRPDGKTQVTVQYAGGDPVRVDTIIVSTQHKKGIDKTIIENDIRRLIISPIVPEHLIDKKTRVFINPSGSFVKGGPAADTGLTGRKIISDTYGGMGRHGGGAFSGKDPSKVDRSGAYAARWVAKNIVAAGLAKKCEVQLSYAIGIAEPVSVMIDTFGTSTIPESELKERINRNFDLRPGLIIRNLNLLSTNYSSITCYGHFGRDDLDLGWEKTESSNIRTKADYIRDMRRMIPGKSDGITLVLPRTKLDDVLPNPKV